MKNYLVLIGTSLVLMACVGTQENAAGRHAGMSMGAADASVFQKPIDDCPSALGPYTWSISTDSDLAQRYFKQGLQMRYAFGVNDSARSFREARLADPDCAICYWGEAFALGSFLNGGMTALKAPYAHEAIEKAVELSNGASSLERDLILAARDRYPSDYNPDNRRPVDEAFAQRMKVIHEKYPDHPDVAVVYAISLFLLEERRGHRDVADPDLVRLYGVLTGVLAKNIKHPGACHLYIHATESSQRPDLALTCADYLSAAIPVASHIQHMPSHTWNEVGLWGKSVRANMAASHSDQKAARNLGFSYGPSHNLHMLLFAASMDGQGAVATQAGKDYAKITNNTMYQVLTLLRFGRFDEIPQITSRPEGEVGGGYWDFAQGYASLRNGDMAVARRYLVKVKNLALNSKAKFRQHEVSQLMGLSAAILEGEILREQGDTDGAIAAFRRAAELDD
ncbi:MAG: hypothetical protein IIC61_13920 [Proteobacteria bacterium]|nr:hypothetical protein [Pseudomonadota bacterium]